MKIDPNFVPALVGEAIAVEIQLSQKLADGDASTASQDIDRMDNVTLRAVNTNSNDSWAWSKRADALAWQRRRAEALTANARARELSPDSATFVAQQANFVLSDGRPSEAIVIAKRAIALDPESVQYSGASSLLCEAGLLRGAYDDAAPACETAAGFGADWWSQLLLVALYAQRNEVEETAHARTALLKLRPGLTIAKLKVNISFNAPAYQQLNEKYIQAGLRKAGIPDH